MENNQFTKEELTSDAPQPTTIEEAIIAKDLLLTVLATNNITLDCGIKVMAALIIDCFPTDKDLFKRFLEVLQGAWDDKAKHLLDQVSDEPKELEACK